MARHLRLEFARALYHFTLRGDCQEDVFLCDDDRRDWLAVLGIVCGRLNWVVHAFRQITNHYRVEGAGDEDSGLRLAIACGAAARLVSLLERSDGPGLVSCYRQGRIS